MGKVLKVHVIKEQFDVLTDQGVIKRFGAQLYDKENGLPPKGYQLPKEYGLITNETDKPILKYEAKTDSSKETTVNKQKRLLEKHKSGQRPLTTNNKP